MNERYRSPKGFQDILPPESFVWEFIERAAQRVFHGYGYREIRVPVVEHTEVFVRSIGESTDIVEKEMYTFSDRAGRSLTLRPEGTAPVVRSYVQNGLHTRTAPQKFFYRGPMFRYERPQKGRFRQFYQIGAEAFGVDDPLLDAEMLALLRDFFVEIGLGGLSFEVNSIGCPDCRPAYREALRGFFGRKIGELCGDCARRLDANPLRILDCKVPACIEASKGAPEMGAYLCDKCRTHFTAFRSHLGTLGISHIVNPRLVRGLDYYTSTTFEITTAELGAQKAVAAGGRYDRLVAEFGGPATPAVGFAVGMERIAELLSAGKTVGEPRPDLFVAWMGETARGAALGIVSGLRRRGLWCEMSYGEASLRNQFKRADRAGSRYVFIVGDEEIAGGKVKYRRLSDGGEGFLDSDDIDGMAGMLARP